MNFSDEEYVRLYTSDTVTWKCLEWQGQALLSLALRKFDRAGVLEFGRHGPEKALMVATGLPLEVISAGLPKLVSEEVWVIEPDRIFWPKYVDAQTCTRSERVRQRASRARRQAQPQPTECDTASRIVTSGHENASGVTDVTECHPRRGEARQGLDPSLLDSSDLGGSDAREPPPTSVSKISTGAKRFAESFETHAPDQIEFTPEHRAFEANGIDLQEAWLQCRDYRRANKDRREDWGAEFLSWLRREAKFKREGRSRPAGVRAPPQPNNESNRYECERVIR